ncbi:RHS repeat protein [Paenibacillus agilis]|uniref:RHS repeat protein n=1 Tax=Paenibacillus agilis TaxID=3020863 RepID=A0A559IX25_9BACL|nr:RHS repeat domain-containing protein [Paenibacillus agilis]TVX92185.1 RHS repeat protein [Paenibacillus agilis]
MTKQVKKYLFAVVLFIAVISVTTLTYRVTWSAASTEKNVYRASTDYSTIQGDNNWYYQEWDGSTYTNLAWDNSKKLWQGKNKHATIAANIHHPDHVDIVRKWVAPKSGIVHISGQVAKSNPTCGDGVKAIIRKNNKLIWSTAIGYDDKVGVSASYTTNVATGDALYFIVNQQQENSCDGTFWDPTITYDEKPLKYTASEGYSSIQGQNNWYYEEQDKDKFYPMTWIKKENLWRGSTEFSMIGHHWQHPEARDSVRTWAAPTSGVVQITGKLAKENISCGNGVIATIYKNDNAIWSTPIVFDDKVGFQIKQHITVRTDDRLRFVISQNGENSCDGTIFNPTITYDAQPIKYTASEGYSPIQGQNNWYYEERDKDKFYPMTWIKAETLWRGNAEYSMIGHHWQHPEARDSVRTWLAPTSGVVRITGPLVKDNVVCGNGVIAKIYKNDKVVWTTPVLFDDKVGYNIQHDLSVRADDRIRFVTSQNGENSCDGTTFNPTITYLDPKQPLSYSSRVNFGSAQGQSNWYYQELNGLDYVDMTFDAKKQEWKGAREFSTLTFNMYHPDPSAAVRKWVAPKSGTVRLTGNPVKGHISCGNGVETMIYKGKTKLWGTKLAANDDKGTAYNMTTPVSQGQALYFVVNAGENIDCDSTFWDAQIEYTTTSNMSDYAYDGANRLETITLPSGQVVHYYYDANGNLIQRRKG